MKKTYYRGIGEGLLSKYTQSTPYLCARKDNCRLQESLKENEELTADKERLTVEVERLAVSNHSGGYGSVDKEKKIRGVVPVLAKKNGSGAMYLERRFF